MLCLGASLNEVFYEHGRVRVRSIRQQYVYPNILVRPDKCRRYETGHSGEFMKLVSAWFQFSSTCYEQVTEKKWTVEVGHLPIPETVLIYAKYDALEDHLAAEVAEPLTNILSQDGNVSTANINNNMHHSVPRYEDLFTLFLLSGGICVDGESETYAPVSVDAYKPSSPIVLEEVTVSHRTQKQRN